jgi:hypothetical protein
MKKILLAVFLGAFCALAVNSARVYSADEGITIDIAPWQELIKLHQKYYLGNRTPAQSSSIRLTDDGVKDINQGEIFWKHMDNIFTKLAYAKSQKETVLLETLPKCDKWLGEQIDKIKPLLDQVKTCRDGLADIEKTFQDSAKMAISNRAEILKQLSRTPDEITYCLRSLAEKATSDKKKAILYITELKCILKRLEDIDNWMVLQADLLRNNIKICSDYIKSYPGEYALGNNLPCGNGIMMAHRDVVEFQRQVEDILCLTSSENSLLGKDYGATPPPAGDSLSSRGAQRSGENDCYLVSPLSRIFYQTLKTKLKDSARVTKAFQKGLENQYDLTYLNCVFYKYSKQKAEDILVEVIKRWEKVTPESDKDVIFLLEVINPRQGTFWTAENPKDRFEPHLVECAEKLEGKDRAEAFANAHKLIFDCLKSEGISYGGHPATIEGVFKEKKTECTGMTNIFTYVLANAGYAGSYAIRNDTGRHWYNCFAFGDKFEARDLMNTPNTSNDFPPMGNEFACRYVRTVNAGIEADIYVGEERKLIRCQISYYNQKTEVIELGEKKSK